MKKLIALFLFITTFAFAWTFYGHQSLNGLQTTTLFVPSNDGIYFINGRLTLPQPSLNGSTGYSQVVATVDVEGVSVYAGIAGSSGFTIPQIALASGDLVTVTLSSAADIDQPLNAVRGEVYFGNAF